VSFYAVSSGLALAIAVFIVAVLARIKISGDGAASVWVIVPLLAMLAWNCIMFSQGIIEGSKKGGAG
jgi:hypothetical protein